MKKQLTVLLFLAALTLLFTVGTNVAHGHEDMFYHDGCHNCLMSLSLFAVFTVFIVIITVFLPLNPYRLATVYIPLYSIEEYQQYCPRNRLIYRYYCRPPPRSDR